MIVRVINDFDRAKMILESIREPWIDIVDIPVDNVTIVNFGSQMGKVLYIYETSKQFEAKELEEIATKAKDVM